MDIVEGCSCSTRSRLFRIFTGGGKTRVCCFPKEVLTQIRYNISLEMIWKLASLTFFPLLPIAAVRHLGPKQIFPCEHLPIRPASAKAWNRGRPSDPRGEHGHSSNHFFRVGIPRPRLWLCWFFTCWIKVAVVCWQPGSWKKQLPWTLMTVMLNYKFKRNYLLFLQYTKVIVLGQGVPRNPET